MMQRRRKFAPRPDMVREDNSDKEIRLNKYIADSGFCSRRKADVYIQEGLVSVNGKVIDELGSKVQPGVEVTVDGDPIAYYRHKTYILLNKPKDVITTTDDNLGRKTVMDVVKRRERIYPVGRLDRNTTGALLMTNDGDLSHRLMHPSFKAEKTYRVGLDKPLDFDHAAQIANGVLLDDSPTAPCQLFVDPDDYTVVSVVIHEGKYREVRRIFEKFDYKVKKLDRKLFAGLSVAGMKRGEYRFLSFKEIQDLKRSVGI